MTFGVPYSFVPGTKAKADEVNANFIDVLSKIEDTNLRIDETISNANSKNQENSAKFEEVEAKFEECADLALSNLSSAGMAVLDKKANASDIDGKWVLKASVFLNMVTLSNSETTVVSLSSYLPNDGNIYEVMFSMEGSCGTAQFRFDTGYGSVYALYAKSIFGGAFNMVVSPARTLNIYRTGLCSGTNKMYLRATAYRKVR